MIRVLGPQPFSTASPLVSRLSVMDLPVRRDATDDRFGFLVINGVEHRVRVNPTTGKVLASELRRLGVVFPVRR